MKKITLDKFLDKLWNINPSYKERFNYNSCNYNGMTKNIKITCKKHNNTFDVLASNHISSAIKEIKKNIILSGGCSKCYSIIVKTNKYLNNDKNLPEDYNNNDWKFIEGFENYIINKKGDIWSKISNKYIKPYTNTSGYLVATLYNKNKKNNTKKRVHILVASHFIINPKPKIYNIVNHIDGNRENTYYKNLEWVDRSGNTKHAHKNKKNYKVKKKVIINKVDTDIEIWKEVLPEFPNYYVSNFGNVKSIIKGKERQLRKNNSSIEYDHLSVGMCNKNGKYYRKQVHRLVLTYHLNVDYDTSDMIVDHIDNNKQNNYIGNLEWVDNHINLQRAMIDGCWERKNRKQKVSHIRYVKWNKKDNNHIYKYAISINLCKNKIKKYVDTKEEAIQTKKELYALMIITNYIKYKKGIYPKYYKLNIDFKKINKEIELL
jgi:hypothetical protein